MLYFFRILFNSYLIGCLESHVHLHKNIFFKFSLKICWFWREISFQLTFFDFSLSSCNTNQIFLELFFLLLEPPKTKSVYCLPHIWFVFLPFFWMDVLSWRRQVVFRDDRIKIEKQSKITARVPNDICNLFLPI